MSSNGKKPYYRQFLVTVECPNSVTTSELREVIRTRVNIDCDTIIGSVDVRNFYLPKKYRGEAVEPVATMT